MIINRTGTLFSRTGFTIALSLLVFFIFAFGSIFYYVFAPMARQSADDLAALIMFSAQTWSELPPDTRYDFIEELYSSHQLTLLTTTSSLKQHPLETPYMHFLEDSLSKRAKTPIPIKTRPNDELWLWVDIPTATQTLSFGFSHDRIGVQPSIIILWVILSGVIITILTSLLLVHRLTLPLQRLYDGTKAFASGQKLASIPETGPHELATLTHSFNKMTREIHELMENRTTLLAGISHDLRTPITRMQLAIEMLDDKAEPQLVQRMKNDLDEMAELIQRTLEIAKGLDKRNNEDSETDLLKLIDQVVTHYQSEDGKAVDWHPINKQSCIQNLNPIALRRVLTNLLENALSYAGNDVICVRCDCGSDLITIEILDRGPGIPAEELEAVFQPFHRLETSRNKATGGSGLGLAIVKQLCEVNGWKVQLHAREGGGIISRLEIPVKPRIRDSL